MKKKFLYIGLGLLVVATVVFLFSPGLALPQLTSTLKNQSLQVSPNGIGNLPLYLNQSGIVVLTFNSSVPIDFYLANSSAFTSINKTSVVGGAARSAAVGLEGKGVFEVYLASKTGAFPYTGFQGVSNPAYIINITSALSAGIYDAMFANSNMTSSAHITAKFLSISQTILQSRSTSLILYIGAAGVAFLVGVGLVIYSFISKDRKKEEATMDEQAANEYERIGKAGKKRR